MQYTSPDLEMALTSTRLFDHRGVDWSRVQKSRYLIHQHLRYDYPGPISHLYQHLVILPPEHYADQRRVAFRFAVSIPTAEITYRLDEFENCAIDVAVPHVEQRIDFDAWILLERAATNQPHTLSLDLFSDPRFLAHSALTQPDDHLRQAAQEIQREGKQGRALAEHIMHWVYTHFTYQHEVTGVHTSAAQALALGKGVCQDYAHIMLALCRLCGLSARYVSGHMLGEGGTHAWVELLLPGEYSDSTLVLPLDPTHDRYASLSYLSIATGRDYFDVAPTSGTYQASYSGQLSGHKKVSLTQLEYTETTLQQG
jgi:transglutaminase-like putative cysteine protease